MSTAIASHTSPDNVYASYALARKEISTIEPIDYFFAKDLVKAFNLSQSQYVELFHLLMALSQSLREGHTCLPIGVIANTQYGYLSDDFGVVISHGYLFSDQKSLNSLLTDLNITADENHPVVFHQNKLYLRRYFTFEQALFGEIQTKANVNITNCSMDLYSQCIEMLFPSPENESNTNITEIDWQKVAVANALNKNFSVIAGGPGTGKTYTVTKLLAALVYLHLDQSKHQNQHKNQQGYESNSANQNSLRKALVAPTGKAAQR